MLIALLLFVLFRAYSFGLAINDAKWQAKLAAFKQEQQQLHDVELERINLANAAAKANEERTIEELQGYIDALEATAVTLGDEAADDPKASSEAINKEAVRRIGRIK